MELQILGQSTVPPKFQQWAYNMSANANSSDISSIITESLKTV